VNTNSVQVLLVQSINIFWPFAFILLSCFKCNQTFITPMLLLKLSIELRALMLWSIQSPKITCLDVGATLERSKSS